MRTEPFAALVPLLDVLGDESGKRRLRVAME